MDGPAHFLVNSRRIDGSTAFKHRLLQGAGWTVVSIPYYHVNALDSNPRGFALYLATLLARSALRLRRPRLAPRHDAAQRAAMRRNVEMLVAEQARNTMDQTLVSREHPHDTRDGTRVLAEQAHNTMDQSRGLTASLDASTQARQGHNAMDQTRGLTETLGASAQSRQGYVNPAVFRQGLVRPEGAGKVLGLEWIWADADRAPARAAVSSQSRNPNPGDVASRGLAGGLSLDAEGMGGRPGGGGGSEGPAETSAEHAPGEDGKVRAVRMRRAIREYNQGKLSRVGLVLRAAKGAKGADGGTAGTVRTGSVEIDDSNE